MDSPRQKTIKQAIARLQQQNEELVIAIDVLYWHEYDTNSAQEVLYAKRRENYMKVADLESQLKGE